MAMDERADEVDPMVPIRPVRTELSYINHLESATEAIDEAKLLAKRYGWSGMYDELVKASKSTNGMLEWAYENRGWSTTGIVINASNDIGRHAGEL